MTLPPGDPAKYRVHTERYLGTVAFVRLWGGGSFWRGLRELWAYDRFRTIAVEPDDDVAEARFWKLKCHFVSDETLQRIRVHEWGHGPNGAWFPELAGEGRGKDRGLRHAHARHQDVMCADLADQVTDARGLGAAYEFALANGRVVRIGWGAH